MATTDLTTQRVRQLLHYDPITGLFAWRTKRRGQIEGRIGVISENGYLRIGIDNAKRLAHRVAWLYCYGEWPSLQLDHINGDRLDNRLLNLRQVSASAQNHNRAPAARTVISLPAGVAWRPDTDKYVAQIKINGTYRYLGIYENPQAAARAYNKAKADLLPVCLCGNGIRERFHATDK